jgi:hypothetical protein
MKKVFIVCLSFIASLSLVSQNTVTPEEAANIAHKCLVMKSLPEQKSAFMSAKPSQIITVNSKNKPVYHIVNMEPEGFVLVSALKSYHPVIAFSYNGSFEYPITAPAVQMWLNNESKKILHSANLPEKHSKIISAWEEYELSDMFSLYMKHEKVQLPMLTTQWNQGIYYNELCPADPSGPDGKTYAGCVATAIGQVMNYFRYPLSGTGTYTSEYTVYGVHSVDYENAAYKWGEMPLKLLRSNQETAKLLYHIGVSVDMNYGPNGSGMWNHKAAHTMSTFFGYTDSTQYNFRDTTTVDWNGMIIDHLDRGIVLYYAGWEGNVYQSGHAFVCDGYQDSSYFHFNWGWGGSFDGYFHIDNLIVGGADFTTMHEAVINGTPATNYPYYCSGTDTLRSLDGTIEDGSGPLYPYNDNSFCSWLIMPHDTVSSIVLDFVKCDLEANDQIRVYSGVDASAPLHGTYTGSGPASVITVPGNAVYIEFQSDATTTANGFLISYKANQVKTCSGLLSLTAPQGIITDGSGSYNYQNSNLCRWRIEPPGAQFIHINFTEFDIDSTDYVRVSDLSTNTTIGTFRGTDLPQDINVFTDKVLVLFNTSATRTAGGFTLNYSSSQADISEVMENTLSVFPNPADEAIQITFNNMYDVSELFVDFYSLTGQKLQSVRLTDFQGSGFVNTSFLPDGFYMMNISDGESFTVNRKIIIAR